MLILGLDVGGTNSRALLADTQGRRIRTGTAPGGNPVAHPVAEAIRAIETALRAALEDTDPAEVQAAVIGLAGLGRLAEPDVKRQFDQMWRRVGLRCRYRAVADPLVAFAAGTPASHGTLLLAGTGAIASQIRDGEIERYADGHGWLLGDLGSGFWIGREAIRATLDYLDGWAPPSGLTRAVLAELLGDADVAVGRDSTTAVVNAVRRDSPVALSRFARTVERTAAEGDTVAHQILHRAAEHLVTAASRVRGAAPDPGPLVLAGGLLTADTTLAARVRVLAAQRWPGVTITAARDGAAGAAWLAARDLPDAELPPSELHARLLGDAVSGSTSAAR